MRHIPSNFLLNFSGILRVISHKIELFELVFAPIFVFCTSKEGANAVIIMTTRASLPRTLSFDHLTEYQCTIHDLHIEDFSNGVHFNSSGASEIIATLSIVSWISV